MSEIKFNQRNDTELHRFDLASLFDTVPTDRDVKIIELRRGALSVRDRLRREKLLRASEGRDTGPTKIAA